jgi:FKBP-type peptidyl-prolyl cis-trans isomerase
VRKLALLPLAAVLAVAACGGDDDAASGSTVPELSLGPTTTFAPKPEVSIPEEPPTEMKVTDLKVGTGPKAKKGDLISVHYIGVRSEDGTEFDSNFKSAEGFTVTLGKGGVIEGWDKGLIGVQAGGVRQLDIPSKLAYKDQPQGEIIKAGDALSFVIQVDFVITPPNTKQLKEQIEPSEGAEEVTTNDLVAGTGAEAKENAIVRIHLILLRGDNEVVLENTWDGGEPQRLQLVAADVMNGLTDGIVGMKVGGRRAITIPPEEAFGPDGNPQAGLPRDTDVIAIVDLLGTS